jgi:hypothetical protein
MTFTQWMLLSCFKIKQLLSDGDNAKSREAHSLQDGAILPQFTKGKSTFLAAGSATI